MKTTLVSLRYLMFACVIIFSFIACGDDDEQGSNAVIEVLFPAEKQILLNSKDNEPITITFSASNDWTAIPSHRWIDLSKITGSAGENAIIVSVDENDSFTKRIGTITIKDKVSGKSTDITVTQGEKDGVLTFSTPEDNTTLSIDNENQTITAEVSVQSNYDYTLTSDADWLTYQKIGRNDDGSMKYVFHADPEKLYEAAGYEAKNATVSFEYQSEVTRSPQAKQYIVKFPGITPKVEFLSKEESGEEEETEKVVTKVTLTDEMEAGVYKSVVQVKSNIAWVVKNTSDYVDTEIIGENKSACFFETQTSLNIMLKEGKLDTEDLNNGKIEIDDAHTNEAVKALSVIVKGVGSDYIYIDETSFVEAGKDQMTGVYMFPAEGGEMPFKVKASDMADVTFYLATVEVSMGVPSIIRSKDAATGWPSFGGVDKTETVMRSVVETGLYTIWTSARTEMESYGGGDPYANRFVALFAVSNTKYPDFDSMFDGITEEDWENGTLKEELEGKYIILGQKGMEVNYYFDSKKLPENGTVLNIGLDGGDIVVDYETNAEGVTLYKNVEWTDQEDPYKWSGDNLGVNDPSLTFGEGQITIKVPKSTTERTFNLGFGAYVGEGKNEYMLRTFTIKQSDN